MPEPAHRVPRLLDALRRWLDAVPRLKRVLHAVVSRVPVLRGRLLRSVRVPVTAAPPDGVVPPAPPELGAQARLVLADLEARMADPDAGSR